VLGKAATRSGSVQWRQTRTVAMGDRQHRPGRPRTPRSTHEATITSQILERTPLNRPLSTELTADKELIDQQLTDAARTHIQILRRFSNTHNIHGHKHTAIGRILQHPPYCRHTVRISRVTIDTVSASDFAFISAVPGN